MVMVTAEGLTYRTDGEAGVGGRIKARPEDFVVDEVPLVEPADRGEFLYLLVEKRRRLTTDVVRFFSQHFRVARGAIGYAGLKDKHAITRQWFSIEHAKEDRARQFEDGHVRILDLRRHHEPLRRGRLRGNRFAIKLRGVRAADAPRAQRILDRLARAGTPNFVGEQRFGYRNDNHLLGRDLLRGDLRAFLDRLLGRPIASEPQANRQARAAYDSGEWTAALDLWPTVHRFERQALGPLSRGAPLADAVNGIDRTHRMLMISAFQSAVFNRLLDERLREGRLDQLEAGDLIIDHATRRIESVKDPAADQSRCDRLAVSPTGPMWGWRMRRAGEDVGRRELTALLEAGVRFEELGEGDYSADGSRRPMRMPIRDPYVSAGADEHGPFIFTAFELPRGSFATVVMREITKNGA